MGKGKYETHVEPKLKLIEAWSRDGLTLDQIAHNLGIAVSTFKDYKNRHSDLSDALKRGREEVDIEVENALFKNATGYYYTEQVATPSGMVVTVEKYAHPNTTAQIFWLKNRKPRDWRDKQDIEHSGQVTTVNEQRTHIIQELVTDQDIAERIKHNFRRGLVSGVSQE